MVFEHSKLAGLPITADMWRYVHTAAHLLTVDQRAAMEQFIREWDGPHSFRLKQDKRKWEHESQLVKMRQLIILLRRQLAVDVAADAPETLLYNNRPDDWQRANQQRVILAKWRAQLRVNSTKLKQQISNEFNDWRMSLNRENQDIEPYIRREWRTVNNLVNPHQPLPIDDAGPAMEEDEDEDEDETIWESVEGDAMQMTQGDPIDEAVTQMLMDEEAARATSSSTSVLPPPLPPIVPTDRATSSTTGLPNPRREPDDDDEESDAEFDARMEAQLQQMAAADATYPVAPILPPPQPPIHPHPTAPDFLLKPTGKRKRFYPRDPNRPISSSPHHHQQPQPPQYSSPHTPSPQHQHHQPVSSTASPSPSPPPKAKPKAQPQPGPVRRTKKDQRQKTWTMPGDYPGIGRTATRPFENFMERMRGHAQIYLYDRFQNRGGVTVTDPDRMLSAGAQPGDYQVRMADFFRYIQPRMQRYYNQQSPANQTMIRRHIRHYLHQLRDQRQRILSRPNDRFIAPEILNEDQLLEDEWLAVQGTNDDRDATYIDVFGPWFYRRAARTLAGVAHGVDRGGTNAELHRSARWHVYHHLPDGTRVRTRIEDFPVDQLNTPTMNDNLSPLNHRRTNPEWSPGERQWYTDGQTRDARNPRAEDEDEIEEEELGTVLVGGDDAEDMEEEIFGHMPIPKPRAVPRSQPQDEATSSSSWTAREEAAPPTTTTTTPPSPGMHYDYDDSYDHDPSMFKYLQSRSHARPPIIGEEAVVPSPIPTSDQSPPLPPPVHRVHPETPARPTRERVSQLPTSRYGFFSPPDATSTPLSSLSSSSSSPSPSSSSRPVEPFTSPFSSSPVSSWTPPDSQPSPPPPRPNAKPEARYPFHEEDGSTTGSTPLLTSPDTPATRSPPTHIPRSRYTFFHGSPGSTPSPTIPAPRTSLPPPPYSSSSSSSIPPLPLPPRPNAKPEARYPFHEEDGSTTGSTPLYPTPATESPSPSSPLQPGAIYLTPPQFSPDGGNATPVVRSHQYQSPPTIDPTRLDFATPSPSSQPPHTPQPAVASPSASDDSPPLRSHPPYRLRLRSEVTPGSAGSGRPRHIPRHNEDTPVFINDPDTGDRTPEFRNEPSPLSSSPSMSEDAIRRSDQWAHATARERRVLMRQRWHHQIRKEHKLHDTWGNRKRKQKKRYDDDDRDEEIIREDDEDDDRDDAGLPPQPPPPPAGLYDQATSSSTTSQQPPPPQQPQQPPPPSTSAHDTGDVPMDTLSTTPQPPRSWFHRQVDDTPTSLYVRPGSAVTPERFSPISIDGTPRPTTHAQPTQSTHPSPAPMRDRSRITPKAPPVSSVVDDRHLRKPPTVPKRRASEPVRSQTPVQPQPPSPPPPSTSSPEPASMYDSLFREPTPSLNQQTVQQPQPPPQRQSTTITPPGYAEQRWRAFQNRETSQQPPAPSFSSSSQPSQQPPQPSQSITNKITRRRTPPSPEPASLYDSLFREPVVMRTEPHRPAPSSSSQPSQQQPHPSQPTREGGGILEGFLRAYNEDVSRRRRETQRQPIRAPPLDEDDTDEEAEEEETEEAEEEAEEEEREVKEAEEEERDHRGGRRAGMPTTVARNMLDIPRARKRVFQSIRDLMCPVHRRADVYR